MFFVLIRLKLGEKGLKPGNYLLATLDLLNFKDENGYQNHIIQVISP